MAVELNAQNFDEKIAQGACVVDFWAPWCGPCRMMTPILERISDEMGDLALVAKVNTDEESALAAKYGIQSIPTLIYFKDGKPVKTVTGVQSQVTVVKELKALI